MSRQADLEKENAALRRLLKSASKPRKATGSSNDARQLELPKVRRFPLAEFAGGIGKRVPLPELVQEIADVVGRENAVRLVEGTLPTGKRSWRRSLYVPSAMRDNHRIVDLIGLDAAKDLSKSHANSVLELPPCKALRRAYLTITAQRLSVAGATVQEIAAELSVDQKTALSLLDDVEYWSERFLGD